MNLNIKLFLRCLAGVSYSVILGHEYEAFEQVFGFSFITFSAMVIIFVFYLFAFVCQFTDLFNVLPKQVTRKCHRHCHKVQWSLVIVNIAFAVVGFISELHGLTPVKGLGFVVETLLIAFPDYFIGLIGIAFGLDKNIRRYRKAGQPDEAGGERLVARDEQRDRGLLT